MVSKHQKWFFSGRYADVVARTFDEDAEVDEQDVAFVVGALTFLGRVDDAQMWWDGRRRHRGAPHARTIAAAEFFLGVAYARTGDFDRAHRLLVRDLRARVRRDDPWTTAFVWQGAAAYRFFTGRYRSAAKHAYRALSDAHAARFGYLQMFATDMRGHSLARIGQYRAGIALLEQAKMYARRLDFGFNAHAIDCAIASYVAEFVAREEALGRLETLLRKKTHDGYSKRTLLADVAVQLSLRGRNREAVAALDEADELALRQGSRRAKVESVVARLRVLRFSEGATACAELLDRSHDLVDEADVAFRAEILGIEAWAFRSTDPSRRERAVRALESRATTHEHHRSRAVLEQLATRPLPPRAFPEDEVTPLLHAVAARDARVLPRLIALGWLGPIPELLGIAPGRRVIVLSSENALLFEDHGELQLRESPPRWCATVLRELSKGIASKEQLVAALWGLRSYRPERHDPLVRTTIHRLRSVLAPHGDWIERTEDGYQCTVGVVFVGSPDAEEAETPLVEGQTPEVETVARKVVSSRIQDEGPVERVLEKLHDVETAAVRDLERSLGYSESTILRALRVLVKNRRVVRMGHARSTRCRART